MKLPVRIILIALCAVIIAGMPFFISSPSLLHEAAEEWQDNGDGDDEGIALDFGKSFLHYGWEKDSTTLYDNIDAITPAQIQQVAQEIFDKNRITTLIYR